MDIEASPVVAERALESLKGEDKVTQEQQTEITDLSENILQEEKKGLMSRPKSEEEEL